LAFAIAPAIGAQAPAVIVHVGDDTGSVAHDMFWPDNVVITEGQTVQWMYTATDTPHTVTALPSGGPPAFDSSPNVTREAFAVLFGPGGVLHTDSPGPGVEPVSEFNHTFATNGTFTVRCKIHPEMIQVITVNDDTSAKGPV